MNGFPFGAVVRVQREDGIEKIRSIFDSIAEAGLRVVVVWPSFFWWEEQTDTYPYATGITILREAEARGLRIVMELSGQIPTLEYTPDSFLTRDHWVETRNGTASEFDWSYYPPNLNHPEIRAEIARRYAEAARAYRSSPALYGYDIWNETMFTSFDRYTIQRFREWLQTKYSAISALNDAWDRSFERWEDVYPSRWHWASVMPLNDWQEFREWNVGDLLKEWREVIINEDPNHPVLADNVGSMVANGQWGFDRPQNDLVLARSVDECGFSFYPKNDSPMPAWERWSSFAGMRGASIDGSFWIAEMQTHTQTMLVPSSRVEPHELRWWTLEALAAGARGIVYWKWRPFERGFQTFGRGLVDTTGALSPRGEEVRDIAGKIMELFPASQPVETRAPAVGIVYSSRSDRFLRSYVERFPSDPIELCRDSASGAYRAFWTTGIDIDYILDDQITSMDPERFPTVILSNNVTISHNEASFLQDYVQKGGVLVVDGKLGIVDDVARVYRDQPGGPLHDLIGVRYRDVYPLSESTKVDLSSPYTGSVLFTMERYLVESEDPTVEVIGRFTDRSPAVVLRRFGLGSVWYLAGQVWSGHRIPTEPNIEIAREIVRASDRVLYEDVTIKRRCIELNDSYALFLFNYSEEKRTTTIDPRRVTGERSARIVGATIPFDLRDDGVYTVRLGPNDAGVIRIEVDLPVTER
jgi:beta-galactosidase